MNRIKLHVRKGDQVEVVSGNHRGSTGKVLEVIARKQRVLVEGVRMIKRHLKKSQDNPQGKIAEREGPIHISNVKLVERAERDGKGKVANAKSTKRKTAKVEKKKAPAKKKPAKEEA
ncbi:MAG: 50S ribosomal protein L24 [Verrucomicrobiota bacterium]|nr:50S ribosomal protein L24 [Verrucomicrobiota bacterium]